MPALSFLEGVMVQVPWVSRTGRGEQPNITHHHFLKLIKCKWFKCKTFFLHKVHCDTLTVAPSLIDMGLDFFASGLLMLKPILETLRGAGGSSEDSSSSSGVRCWDVRLTAVPSPPTLLQETGLVFTLPSSSCGPA